MYVTATGGSAIKAVEVILEHGVPEDRIIFINLVRIVGMYETGRGRPYCVYSRSLGPVIVHVQIASPEGLRNFCTKYPTTRVVSAQPVNLCVLDDAHGMSFIVQITGWIDEGLNEKSYIIPGLGDFGERRYGRAMQSRSCAPAFCARVLLVSSDIAH